ncbi:lysophospholipid acyltransferase family protein [Aliidiomarina indica]|uniref:lysophospholipid acyltransferase family protein n=1 Tax=Aliidiomarina indica TaxID=2749147 RepID=UPI00188FC393|nr:lysophospholipid acyltransferase family protein [Aliidiomarina indica]
MQVQDITGVGSARSYAQRVNRAWRVCATGLSFFTFGLGGVVLSVTLIPLLYLCIWKSSLRKKVARESVRLAFQCFTWWMHFLRVIDYDFDALPLKTARGKMVIANHPTLIDVVALISMTRSPDCVVKADLFRNPFVRLIIRSTGYISNSDPELLIKECRDSLAEGNNLIIFPEGTRTKSGQQVRFQRGAAHIALRTKARIIAVDISCVPETLRKGEPWYCSPLSKPKLTIKYVQEINVDEYLYDRSTSQAVRRLNRDLETIYKQV